MVSPLLKDESQETLTGLIRARGCQSPPWPGRSGTRGGSCRRQYGRLQLREGRARARRGRDAVAGGYRGRRRGGKVGHRILLRRQAEWNSGQLVSGAGPDVLARIPKTILQLSYYFCFVPSPSWSRAPAPAVQRCCPSSVNAYFGSIYFCIIKF